MYRQTDGDDRDVTVVPGSGTGPHDTHIAPVRPNTVVVTATASGFYASRHIFFSYLADQIKYADGRTTFNSLVTACSSKMSQNDDEIYRAQAPMVYSLLRSDLVLPRSLLRDNTRVNETNGTSSNGR